VFLRAQPGFDHGHFIVTGGTGNDIVCLILDEDGFTNFRNGHPANASFNSGKVTTAKIGPAHLVPGEYYVVLDNRFSLFSGKMVQMQAQ
jgi:hypothetical protein